jgi:hypothetical protein
MQPSNNFYLELTTAIQKRFDIIKENLIRLEDDDELEEFSLKSLSLLFSRTDKETQGAKAYFKPDDFNDMNYIVYLLDINMGYELRSTIYHEICHFLCRKYLDIKNRCHCLEFAIVAYALSARYDRHDTTFFLRTEDIYEDRAFPFLKINLSHFDNFITVIEFNSIRQLMSKAKKLANEIRKNSVPFNLYDNSKDI